MLDCQYFTKIDLLWGYWQIPMLELEEHQHKTAFVMPFSQYQFRMLQFGLTNAPVTFSVRVPVRLQPSYTTDTEHPADGVGCFEVQLRQAEQLDRRRVPSDLAVGDYALLSTKDLSLSSPTKFTPWYLGPFKVLEVKAIGNAVRLELLPTLKIEPFKPPDPNHGPSSVAQPPPVMIDDNGEYYEIELIVAEHTIRMRGRNVV
eukprot:320456-Rhodomonas_salina.2